MTANANNRKKSFLEQLDLKLKSKKTKQPRVSELDSLKQDLVDLNLLEEKKKTSFIKKLSTVPSRFVKTLISASKVKDVRTAANRLFSDITKLYPEYFIPLTDTLENSDIRILPKTYIGLMTAAAFLVAACIFWVILTIGIAMNLSWVLILVGLIVAPFAGFSLVFLLFYVYPFQKLKEKKKSIETNLPFAITHMAAVASSGVPPEKAFEMLVEFGDYGGVTEESKTIVRQVKVMGADITTALYHVAKRTPSETFKELLYGIISIIESGGNMKDYLNEMAEIALFNYKLARKRYVETLSTYADIYTAILIAAPMFLVSVLVVMNIVPNTSIGGLSIEAFISLGVYVLIPAANIAFLAFITYTQPEI